MTYFKFTPHQIEQLNKVKLYLHGYTLIRTCFACPEQYDVYDSEGNMVAYFRLRHGTFRVDVPDVGGDNIVSTNKVKGDGEFYDDERFYWLNHAVEKVIEYYLNTPWISTDFLEPDWIKQELNSNKGNENAN